MKNICYVFLSKIYNCNSNNSRLYELVFNPELSLDVTIRVVNLDEFKRIRLTEEDSNYRFEFDFKFVDNNLFGRAMNIFEINEEQYEELNGRVLKLDNTENTIYSVYRDFMDNSIEYLDIKSEEDIPDSYISGSAFIPIFPNSRMNINIRVKTEEGFRVRRLLELERIGTEDNKGVFSFKKYPFYILCSDMNKHIAEKYNLRLVKEIKNEVNQYIYSADNLMDKLIYNINDFGVCMLEPLINRYMYTSTLMKYYITFMNMAYKQLLDTEEEVKQSTKRSSQEKTAVVKIDINHKITRDRMENLLIMIAEDLDTLLDEKGNVDDNKAGAYLRDASLDEMERNLMWFIILYLSINNIADRKMFLDTYLRNCHITKAKSDMFIYYWRIKCYERHAYNRKMTLLGGGNSPYSVYVVGEYNIR